MDLHSILYIYIHTHTKQIYIRCIMDLLRGAYSWLIWQVRERVLHVKMKEVCTEILLVIGP